MTTPTLRDLIALDSAAEVRLNPSGTRAAVTVQHPHWEDNRYCRDVWIIDTGTKQRQQLTRFADCSQLRWVDDDTLAVLKSDGAEDSKPQVHLYKGLIGDGWKITDAADGVRSFEVHSAGIVYLANNSDDAEYEARTEKFGNYQRFESEPGRTALYYLDVERLATFERESARATKAERDLLLRPEVELSELLTEPMAIQGVVPSPAGDAVYVNARPTDDINRVKESSVHRIAFDPSAAVEQFLHHETATKRADAEAGIAEESSERREHRDDSYLGTVRTLPVPEATTLEAVSPDGQRLVLQFGGRDSRMSTNAELWVGDREALLDAQDPDALRTHLRDVTTGVDQACFAPIWHHAGIDVTHAQGTTGAITRLDPDGEEPPQRIDTGAANPAMGFHTTPSGQVAFVGDNATSYPEAWILNEGQPVQLTDFGSQLQGWDLGEVRTITWTSTDGTEIEGVLRLPPNFDESRRYPLAFVVHGGPTWMDLEQLVPMTARRYYPEIQLASMDVIVLHPNYRGSLGRGVEFQELNVGNLGVGDLWDVESAIDHLDNLGYVDTSKVGCMGWSQGGYISAFAGLHSDRFTAVSVGAGISDWYTYAISNDIPDFTRDFLRTSLFDDDRSALTAAAPIAAIGQAKTPMLIQHGAKDQRVPLTNATELYRGLQEKGVPVELFVYPDFGHPITKPHENHAVLHQNLTWFSHWLLGEELDWEGSDA